MDRKTKPTVCETIISETWHLLKREISLDNEVKLMIEEGIITANQVTGIINDNKGKDETIVEEILFTIQKQGSGGMHTLLEILKFNSNTEITNALFEASNNKDTNCNCEKSKFLEAQDIKSDTQKRDQGAISSLEITIMSDQISKLMENAQKVDLLEKKVTALEENMEKLKKTVNDLKKKLEESEREREMLKAENTRLECELAIQKDIHTKLMDAKEKEIKKLENDLLEMTESEQKRKLLEVEITRLKDELAMQNDTHKKAMDVQEIEKIKLEKDWQEKYTLLQDSMQKVRNNNEEKRERLINLNKEIISIQKAYDETLLEKTKADAIIMTQGKQIKEDETKHSENVAKLQNKLDELKSQLEDKEKLLIKNSGKEALLGKTKPEVTILTKDTQIKETEIKYLQDGTANQNEPINELRRTHSKLERDLESLKMENEELKNKNKKLTEDLRRLQAANILPPFSTIVKSDHQPPPRQRTSISNPRPQPRHGRGGRANAK